MTQRTHTIAATLALAAALLAAPAPAQTDPAHAGDPGDIDGLVAAAYDAQLAFPVAGAIAELAAQPGDRVEAGAPLARLDDREARAALELATLAAENDTGLQLARQRLELARIHDAETRSGTAAAVRAEDQRAAVNLRIAELEVQRQQHLLDAARRELALAAARHAGHTLAAPVAGVVETVAASPGQVVAAGQPVLRLVSPARLHVEARAPSDIAGRLKEGARVGLYPKSGSAQGSRPPIAGTIARVSATLDPLTDSRALRIDLDPAAAADAALLPGAAVAIDLDPPAPQTPNPAPNPTPGTPAP